MTHRPDLSIGCDSYKKSSGYFWLLIFYPKRSLVLDISLSDYSAKENTHGVAWTKFRLLLALSSAFFNASW